MFLNGLVLMATMALLTPMLQNLLGYPVLASGYLLGARGIGTFVAMSIVGRLLGTRDARPFMLFGLALATLAQWVMVGWNDDVSGGAIAFNGVLQGFGLGFVFTPLNTVAFSTLPRELRTEATGLWTLVRNIGASIGISILIARLVSRTAYFHSQIVEHVTPFNDAMRLPNAAALGRPQPAQPRHPRRDRDAAGGGDVLFQRLPADDDRLARRLPGRDDDAQAENAAAPSAEDAAAAPAE